MYTLKVCSFYQWTISTLKHTKVYTSFFHIIKLKQLSCILFASKLELYLKLVFKLKHCEIKKKMNYLLLFQLHINYTFNNNNN